MTKAFEEVGKSVLTFANLLIILIFFQQYQLDKDMIELQVGFIYGATLYIFGFILIYISELTSKKR